MLNHIVIVICLFYVAQAVRIPLVPHDAVLPHTPRLRETELDVASLRLAQDLPVDPDGNHGPKRIAGYYSLKHTQVCPFLGTRDRK
jgi:hypothetical protein